MATKNNTPVTVGDLTDQIGVPGPHPVLHCTRCGSDCSANKGDYWQLNSTYTFRCCRRLMRLAFKRTIYVTV